MNQSSSESAWQVIYSFNCQRDISLRVLKKDKYYYIDVRKFNDNVPTKIGVCATLNDAIEIYRKLKEIDDSVEFVNVHAKKTTISISKGTAWITKGDNRIYLDRRVYKNFRVYLYIALQRILMPQKEDQKEFAEQLMAVCLMSWFKKNYTSGLFGFGYKTIEEKHFGEDAKKIAEDPSVFFAKFSAEAATFGIKEELVEKMCTSDWIENFVRTKLYPIYTDVDFENTELLLYFDLIQGCDLLIC